MDTEASCGLECQVRKIQISKEMKEEGKTLILNKENQSSCRGQKRPQEVPK